MSLFGSKKVLIATLGFFAISTLALVTKIAPRISIQPVPERSQTDPTHPRLVDSSLPLAHPTRCVASADPGAPPPVLRQMRAQVSATVRRQAYAESLLEIRNLSAVDPGSPGINLDLSMSLLELKQYQQAKEAVDSQIAISECLVNLPPRQLSDYCKAEAFQSDLDRCRQELDTILHNARLGQGFIQSQLRTSTPKQLAQFAPSADLNPRPAPKLQSATHVHATAPRQNRESAERTLAMGSGTDSQLGAYSK